MQTTRLATEVWQRERCAGCALCIAACSKQVLEWGADGQPRRRTVYQGVGLAHAELDACAFCQRFCEAVCPRLESAARQPAMAQWSARASNGALAGAPSTGAANDVVRNVLLAARARGLIDGALIVDADRAGRTRARIATGAGEIAEAVGFQYVWTPLLEALNEAVYTLGLRNLAVVATPCASQALRRLADAPPARLAPYRDALRLQIAMFCPGVYRPEGIQALLAQSLDLALEQVRCVTVSPHDGRLRAQLWDGSVHETALTGAGSYLRAGCARCDDYLGESADLAVGTVGAREGRATLIVRTPAGAAALENAVELQWIELSDEVDEAALKQASAAKDRRERAQAFDELQVLMLDALADPRRRAQARQKFDWLYGGSRPLRNKEEVRYAGCGDCSGC
jgi:coenzyme F420 hydrogenase subunit beta